MPGKLTLKRKLKEISEAPPTVLDSTPKTSQNPSPSIQPYNIEAVDLLAQTEKPKKRRRKNPDGAYSKKSTSSKKRNKSSTHVHAHRFSRETKVPQPNGQITPLRTAIIPNASGIFSTTGHTPELVKNIQEAAKKIPSNRPVIQKDANTFVTPGGHELKKHKNFGLFSVASNHGTDDVKKDPQTKLPDPSLTGATTAVKETKVNKKIVKIRVTPELLKVTFQKFKKNGCRRLTSQNQCLVAEGSNAKDAGATNYVDALNFNDDELLWEWLHLVAYKIVGEKGQTSENMVAGTHAANSDMLCIENTIEKISEHYPNGFDLTVEVDLVQQTHIGIKFSYTIKTDDATLPFLFNGQTPTKTHIVMQAYSHVFVDAFLLTATQIQPSQNNTTQSASTSTATPTQQPTPSNTSSQQSNEDETIKIVTKLIF